MKKKIEKWEKLTNEIVAGWIYKYFELEKRNFENQARVEHRKLANSGMFWEFYPTLTGVWKQDKEQWLIEYQKLVDLRAQNNSF